MSRNPPVDLVDVNGNPLGVTAPIPVRLTDGAAFYTAGAGPSAQEQTWSSTIIASSPAWDVSNYGWVSVHVTSAGVSSTLGWQCSNDGVNWFGVELIGSASTSSLVTATGSAGIFHGPLPARYFRLNLTAISSGTETAIVEFFPVGRGPLTQVTSVTVSGTVPVSVAATLTVKDSPVTSGGLTKFRLLSLATTNANSVKASAGQVYGYHFYNTSAAVKFVKLYDKASAPTVGTDTPVMTIPIAPSGTAIFSTDKGIPFAAGIALAITNLVADSDATAVALNDVVVNLFYF